MAIDATGQDNYTNHYESRQVDREADRRASESSDSSTPVGEAKTNPTLTVNGKETEIYHSGGKEYFYAKDENGKLLKDGEGNNVKIETKDLLSLGMKLDDIASSEITTEKMTNGTVVINIDKDKDGKTDIIMSEKGIIELSTNPEDIISRMQAAGINVTSLVADKEGTLKNLQKSGSGIPTISSSLYTTKSTPIDRAMNCPAGPLIGLGLEILNGLIPEPELTEEEKQIADFMGVNPEISKEQFTNVFGTMIP